MVIQELQQQDAIQTSPHTAQVFSVFIPEAILPARQFTPAHPGGVRLTAYRCVHPLVTCQFYATAGNALTFTDC
jgi:hypothetical protein